MSRSKGVALVVLAASYIALGAVGLVQGEVPRRMNYQGRLTDAGTGAPLVGEHELVFKLFAESAGGAELWSETDTLEADAQGIVVAVLGAKQPIDVALGGTLWLEVTVDGEVLSPRREMVSVPYALRAATCGNADSLEGFDAASFADAAHNHDGRYFTEAELTTTGTINAPDNPVDWTKIKGVPSGFADGSDSTGGVGDGYSLDAADGNPTDALYVDDEGDVGIGVTNPLSRLHVEDGSNVSGTYAIRGIASSTGDGHQIAGVVGETRSNCTFNPGAGVIGVASSPTGRSSGVMGVASGDQGAGVFGMADHASGETYGVYGECESPNGYAGYFAGAQSYFSGRVGVGFRPQPHTGLYVREDSDLQYAEGIRGEAISTTAQTSRGVVGVTNCADTVHVGAGVMGVAANIGGKSSGVFGLARGARGSAIEGLADHATGENIAIHGSSYSTNGFGCYIYGPRNYFSGKMGIGTENPQSRLHLHGDPSETTRLQFTNAATGPAGTDGTHLAITVDGSAYLANMENRALSLGANGASRIWIHPSGKISMGDVDTTGSVTISYLEPKLILNSTRSTHGSASIDLYHLGTRRCGIGWHSENGALSIGCDYPLFISNDGRLGFNGPDPANVLDVTGDGTTWGGVNGYTEVVGHFRNTLGGHTAVSIDAEANLDPILYLAENGVAYWDLRTDSDNAQKFELRYHGLGMRNDIHVVVDTTGNVGIGTTTPGGYKLYVAGTAYSTGGWSSSDARLKDKIAPIEGALSKALALSGVSFEWRRDDFPDKGLPEGRHYGLIAQEVEKVLPEAVNGGPDGEKAVAYNEIIPVLVEAMKAQDERIEALEQEVRELRDRSAGGR